MHITKLELNRAKNAILKIDNLLHMDCIATTLTSLSENHFLGVYSTYGEHEDFENMTKLGKYLFDRNYVIITS